MEPHTTTADRNTCWETRDAHFACLDREGAIAAASAQQKPPPASAAPAAPPPLPTPAAPAPVPPACTTTLLAYERACLQSWRRHWDERHRNGRPIVGRK